MKRILGYGVFGLLTILIILPAPSWAQRTRRTPEKAPAEEPKKPADPWSSATFNGLKLRLIGPAFTSGRVAALAVNPSDPSHYFAAAASGGVWKTTNAGTTWTPVFDNEGSYSIGAVVLDPKNTSVVWVGTGENNSQRSVSYGDGIYRSEDGGRSWKNVGLKASEHIGRIIIDPRNSNTVYVAAQGPLWGPGGDRGLFKTTDGGKNWNKVLSISENTGVTDVVMDPRNPDTLVAAAYQRRRHYWTLISGGPESALHKSTDAGVTWTKLKTGLPSVDIGRMGLAISPVNPDVIYATVQAAEKKGGIFRSTDRGETWEKRNDFDSTAMYYGKIIADPKEVGRIYVMNVFIMVSDDGGRTLRRLGERSKHVDNHAMWINPANTSHYLVGCDGGIYESFDRGAHWAFKSNLPITQFYDVTVDNAAPFYNVYGGTQDNFSMGGPSRTRSASGITNADWFVTMGGDGFRSQVDPQDANIVYSAMQYGGLVRFDKRTGERMGIQPRAGKDEEPLRWNWDAPFIISPHANSRLYFAANQLFRSDDRGNTWKAISGELSRALDRDQIPVMGKLWGPDAVEKHASTAFYGNASALAEAPMKEGLLYVGSDDGLIQVTEDGGKHWRKVDPIPGVPERAYVSRLLASQHEAATVYAALENHQNNDFAPYLFKSSDAGKSWIPIKGNLPANGPVWAIAEDHLRADLLFVGTEFGIFFSIDCGQKWIQLKGGLPTIAVRDLAIQKRENDLVAATFGRGIYILDNYSPLRALEAETLARESVLFPVKDTLMYIQSQPLGGRGKSFQGEAFYTADNPPFGATISYYLKDSLKSKKQIRQEAEKKDPARPHPKREELRAEEEEDAPAMWLTIKDDTGRTVRRLAGATSSGLQRVTWDLRAPPAVLAPPRAEEAEADSLREGPSGPLVMPGRYSVALAKRVDGVWTPLGESAPFSVTVEGTSAMAPDDRRALAEFQQKAARLQRVFSGALEAANAVKARFAPVKRALAETPSAEAQLTADASALEKQTNELLRALRGDTAARARNENTPPSLSERINGIVGEQRMSTARPTQTQTDQYAIAAKDFEVALARLRTLIEVDLAKLEKAMEAAGAPWTPGRIPEWKAN